MRRNPAVVLFAAATIVLALSQFAAILDPLPEGLNGTYFTTPDWSGPPLRATVDPIPSTFSLYLAWRGHPQQSFSATWTGWMLVLRDGRYTFGTASEHGSSLRVADQLVVDSDRAHQPGLATGSVDLRRGVHRVVVTYFQTAGPPELELQWARNGAPLEPLPAWLLSARPAALARFAMSAGIRFLATVTVWPWFVATVLAIAIAIAASLWRAYTARDAAAAFEWTLLFIGGALLLFVLPHRITSDGEARYWALKQMMEWRELPTATYYSVVGPLASAPLYLLGRTVASSSWWCERFNTLVLLAGIAVMWQLLRREIPAALFRTFALLLIAASMFPYHVQDYFGEVFTATMVAVGLLAVRCRHPLAGWAAVIVGVVSTPATLAGLAAAAAVRIWRTRRLRQGIPVALAAALIVLESEVRHGTLLDSTYASTAGNRTILTYSGLPGFSYPLFFGLLSILFSFGKGLIFYAPGLLLPIRAQLRAISARLLDSYDLWIAFLIGLILIYAKWWAWFGGWTWGPRFFLIAVFPASCALALALHRLPSFSVRVRTGVLGVLTLSTWVAIVAAVFQLATLDICANDTFASLCWYVPEFSPLWRPFVQFTPLTPDGAIVVAYFAAVYLWMAAPLVRELSPRGLALAGDGWRALTRGERWRM